MSSPDHERIKQLLSESLGELDEANRSNQLVTELLTKEPGERSLYTELRVATHPATKPGFNRSLQETASGSHFVTPEEENSHSARRKSVAEIREIFERIGHIENRLPSTPERLEPEPKRAKRVTRSTNSKPSSPVYSSAPLEYKKRSRSKKIGGKSKKPAQPIKTQNKFISKTEENHLVKQIRQQF